MKKRRRNRESLKSFLYILIIGFYFLIHVFISLKILHIGYSMGKMKEEYEYLNLLNKNHNIQFTKLITPENLEKIAKENSVNLVIPKNWCFLEMRKENENVFKETEILEAGTR